MHYVKKATYIDGYKIKITFDDNKSKIVDLEFCLSGKIFEPLKDKKVFKKFKVDEDIETISWDNGADLSPDFLYQIGK